jgi:hypothetical protein
VQSGAGPALIPPARGDDFRPAGLDLIGRRNRRVLPVNYGPPINRADGTGEPLRSLGDDRARELVQA